jgi:TM2 domain-containing membrane protein YozV
MQLEIFTDILVVLLILFSVFGAHRFFRRSVATGVVGLLGLIIFSIKALAHSYGLTGSLLLAITLVFLCIAVYKNHPAGKSGAASLIRTH